MDNFSSQTLPHKSRRYQCLIVVGIERAVLEQNSNRVTGRSVG